MGPHAIALSPAPIRTPATSVCSLAIGRLSRREYLLNLEFKSKTRSVKPRDNLYIARQRDY